MQDQLRAWRIKFRPTRLREQFAAWQRLYNTARPYGALGGHCPADRVAELLPKVPPIEAIHAAYDPRPEWTRPYRFRWDPGARRPE